MNPKSLKSLHNSFSYLMARILTQTLFRNRNLPLKSPLFSAWASHRQFSSEAQLIEIDLDPTSSTSRSSSSSLSDGEFEALALKRLDDLIHGIIVQKSTPDWLPFVPGSSFWVPPRPGTSKVLDLVGKLADQLNPEQSLSLSTSRGWPCSSFFNNNHGIVIVEFNFLVDMLLIILFIRGFFFF